MYFTRRTSASEATTLKFTATKVTWLLGIQSLHAWLTHWSLELNQIRKYKTVKEFNPICGRV